MAHLTYIQYILYHYRQSLVFVSYTRRMSTIFTIIKWPHDVLMQTVTIVHLGVMWGTWRTFSTFYITVGTLFFRELYAYNFDYFWWNKVTSRRPNADREGENMKYIQFKYLHLGAKSGQGQSSRRLQDVTNVSLMPWSMNTLVLITNERQNLTFTHVLVTLIVELRWSAFSCAER